MTSEQSKSRDQKEALVAYWLEKAHESLQSARSEYESGRLSFAMNRLYYAAFYALTALFRDGAAYSRNIKASGAHCIVIW
ncbi:MAG: HEPN domain-containing protein [Deltaproteobacteria bacterium]|jgi:uncharacterized protein (UPF0332 family)|nr:HEPN domain-containing protein [Deltaproteobacteria bacterium]